MSSSQYAATYPTDARRTHRGTTFCIYSTIGGVRICKRELWSTILWHETTVVKSYVRQCGPIERGSRRRTDRPTWLRSSRFNVNRMTGRGQLPAVTRYGYSGAGSINNNAARRGVTTSSRRSRSDQLPRQILRRQARIDYTFNMCGSRISSPACMLPGRQQSPQLYKHTHTHADGFQSTSYVTRNQQPSDVVDGTQAICTTMQSSKYAYDSRSSEERLNLATIQ